MTIVLKELFCGVFGPSRSQLQWPTHENELYAEVHCLKSWRHYVGGRKTKIFTDNILLKYLDTNAQTTPKELT